MPEYLHVSRADCTPVAAGGASARDAAGELMLKGTPAAYRCSIVVLAEETCPVLFEAESAGAARDAARIEQPPFARLNITLAQG
jgi:hypothetical protein